MSETTETPTEGHDGTATQANWEKTVRQVVATELEHSGSEVSAAFHAVATDVDEGGVPSGDVVNEMLEALRGAYSITVSVAEASPDVDADDLPAFQGEPFDG